MAAVSIDKPVAINAALLDLDGTLIDTAPDLHAAACAMLRDFGRAEIPIEHTRQYVGKGMRNLVKRLLSGSLDLSGEEPPDAAMASFRLKWMSAMSGIPMDLRMARIARAASSSSTATRTISQPAFSSRPICATVRSTSRVSVDVMDCTATGAPPPTGTAPTRICLVFFLAIAAGSLMNSPG